MSITPFKTPLFSLSLLGGALLIAGCNQTGTETAPVAGAPSTASQTAPQTASAKMASAKAGKDADGDGQSDHKEAAASGMAGMPGMMARTSTTKLAFSSDPGAIPVGTPVRWTLHITDAKSGDAVNDFEVEMTKKMHLIVVKNDLSWFNHVHPQLQGDGKFTVTTQVPSAGTYKIYADYTVKGVGQEVPQFEFATAGQTVTPAKVSIAPDKMQGPWLKNEFNAHPESEPDTKGGAVYKVALMPMPMPIVAGQDTMLHFQVSDSKGKPVKDLQPYLGAMGHCVILSGDTKSYLHSHPMSGGMESMKDMDHSMGEMKMDGMKMGAMDMNAPAPKSGGPDVIFHTNFPKAGLYKVWGQFQHRGKIITANYVVKVAPGKPGQVAGAVDESKPHTH